MKKIVVALIVLSALALPSQAAANAKVMHFDRMALLMLMSQCAVVLTVIEIEQNMINGNEALTADGVELGNLMEFKNKGGSLSAGSRVLFASGGFSAAAGIPADVVLPDTACEALKPGVKLGYTSSFGIKSDIFTIPAGFDLNTGVEKNGNVIDLDLGGLEIGNSKGATTTIGEGTPTGGGNSGGGEDGDGGGCRISTADSSFGAFALVLSLLGSVLGLRRIARPQRRLLARGGSRSRSARAQPAQRSTLR